MIRIGVIGYSTQADEYVEQLCSLETYQVVGILNTSPFSYKKNEINIALFHSLDDLLQIADAILLVNTDENYVEIAKKCIRAGKHLIIDKSLAFTPEQYEVIINIADEANVKCMIAMTDRFNPAYQALKKNSSNPLFVEVVRTIENDNFTYSSTVVSQLMIQDIDLILHLVKSDIKRISATGIKIKSETSDIANARLEFANGCVVNLTASRIAMKNSHKIKLFEPESYFRVDLLKENVDKIYFKSNTASDALSKDEHTLLINKDITSENIQVLDNNAVSLMFAHFSSCIENNSIPLISPHESFIVLDTVQKIVKKINSLSEE